MAETILQHWILTDFLYPFLLMFFIVFAVLEKTNIFGKDKKQMNAFVAFVVALIFVSAVSPKLIVGDLILFMTIGLIIIFVVLLLWGFINGESEVKFAGKGVKVISFVVIVLALIIALLSITGWGRTLMDFLFHQSWSKELWTNAAFIVVIAGALAAVLFGVKGSDK